MRSRSWPLLGQQRADPGVELLRVDRPRHLEAHAGDVVVVLVLVVARGSRARAPARAAGRRRPGRAPRRSAASRALGAVDAGEAVDAADLRLDRRRAPPASPGRSCSARSRRRRRSAPRPRALSARRAGRFLASTTVTIASSRVLARTPSSTKKVCATGAGLARPVVSMMMPSNLPRRFISPPTMRIRSPRTVQQMQPLFISNTSSSVSTTRSLSTPSSPNSLITTAYCGRDSR